MAKVKRSGLGKGLDVLIPTGVMDNIEANNYFEDLLESSDLTYDDIFIVYAVACITTRLDKDTEVKRLPSNKECTNCRTYIDQVIDIMQPKIIICLGASGLNQYIPGSNLFENVGTKKEFKGIPERFRLL